MKTNSYGLTRYVPKPVRREVRQRCRFGCVICGTALIDYEHFDPDFKDAKEHLAKGITLLCMQHNQMRARGQLSRETVVHCDTDPVCKQQGFANATFDFSRSKPMEVTLGGVTFINCPVMLAIDDEVVLRFDPPTQKGRPFRLSGAFRDMSGATTLTIVDNEWSVSSDVWDIRVEGNRTTINEANRKIALAYTVDPPQKLTIHRLAMHSGRVILQCDVPEVGPPIIRMSSNGGASWSGIGGVFVIENAPAAISIGDSKAHRRYARGIRLDAPLLAADAARITFTRVIFDGKGTDEHWRVSYVYFDVFAENKVQHANCYTTITQPIGAADDDPVALDTPMRPPVDLGALHEHAEAYFREISRATPIPVAATPRVPTRSVAQPKSVDIRLDWAGWQAGT